MFTNVYPREKYISKIRPFYHSDVIKIITGIRRCGKSFILRSIINELLNSGIDLDKIIYLPLDKRGYKNIKTPTELEELIESEIKKEEFHYLIIDEVQNVPGFEPVVHAYQEEGYSIFLTGSNSYLLSEEITTKLTGRYISFEVFPLDFKEYLEMKKFHNMNINQDMYAEFDEYIINGGFPKSLEFDSIVARKSYTENIISEIFKKDVQTRNQISNILVYERVQSFLINNYGASFSINKLMQYFEKENIRTTKPTVRKYIEDLKKAKIIYECNRFDLKSKQAIGRDQKYYLADLSIYFSTNTDNRPNYGMSLENIIYTYLKSCDYKVSIGRIGNLECDFIVRNMFNEYAYIQVAYTLNDGDKEHTDKLKEREYRPFRKIKDSYPRYIITLDRFQDQQEGVRHINAIDLLLGKEKILPSSTEDSYNPRNYLTLDESIQLRDSKPLYSIAEIKEILTPIFKKHKVKKAILFGSYVTGTADSRSDIDILVETNLKGLAFYGLYGDAEKLMRFPLDLIDKSVVEKGSELEKAVEKTGVTIYE